jgi:hypothetical protein
MELYAFNHQPTSCGSISTERFTTPSQVGGENPANA